MKIKDIHNLTTDDFPDHSWFINLNDTIHNVENYKGTIEILDEIIETTYYRSHDNEIPLTYTTNKLRNLTIYIQSDSDYSKYDVLTDLFAESERIHHHRHNKKSPFYIWNNETQYLTTYMYNKRINVEDLQNMDHSNRAKIIRTALYSWSTEVSYRLVTDLLSTLRLIISDEILEDNYSDYEYLRDYKIKNNYRPKILDTSIGYGSALILSRLLGYEYLGFEPNPRMLHIYMDIIGNKDLVSYRLENLTTHENKELYNYTETVTIEDPNTPGVIYTDNIQNCKIFNEPLSFKSQYTNYFDIIISDPPFYNLEVYNEDDPLQSINTHYSFTDWLSGFLFTYISDSWKMLNIDGYLILHIGDSDKVIFVEATLLYCVNELPGCKLLGPIYRSSSKNQESGGIQNQSFGNTSDYQRSECSWIFKKLKDNRSISDNSLAISYPDIYLRYLELKILLMTNKSYQSKYNEKIRDLCTSLKIDRSEIEQRVLSLIDHYIIYMSEIPTIVRYLETNS